MLPLTVHPLGVPVGVGVGVPPVVPLISTVAVLARRRTHPLRLLYYLHLSQQGMSAAGFRVGPLVQLSVTGS